MILNVRQELLNMRAATLALIAFIPAFSCSPIQPVKLLSANVSESTWTSVSKTTSGLSCDPLGRPSNHQHKVTTTAQQAELVTESLGIDQRWWGYSGPTNPHTKDLKFVCDGSAYSVPEPFVNDLLALHVDFPTHASISGKTRVFSMEGCSGEKGYKVHFVFQSNRFQQRILDYTEENDIYIKQ